MKMQKTKKPIVVSRSLYHSQKTTDTGSAKQLDPLKQKRIESEGGFLGNLRNVLTAAPLQKKSSSRRTEISVGALGQQQLTGDAVLSINLEPDFNLMPKTGPMRSPNAQKSEEKLAARQMHLPQRGGFQLNTIPVEKRTPKDKKNGKALSKTANVAQFPVLSEESVPPDDDCDEPKHAYSSISPANTAPSKRRLPPPPATKPKTMKGVGMPNNAAIVSSPRSKASANSSSASVTQTQILTSGKYRRAHQINKSKASPFKTGEMYSDHSAKFLQPSRTIFTQQIKPPSKVIPHLSCAQRYESIQVQNSQSQSSGILATQKRFSSSNGPTIEAPGPAKKTDKNLKQLLFGSADSRTPITSKKPLSGTASNRIQPIASTTNCTPSNSQTQGGFLLQQHNNQQNYFKQSQQLQESKKRDSISGMIKKLAISNKTAPMQTISTNMRPPISAIVTNESDRSYNNITIKSVDKNNSFLLGAFVTHENSKTIADPIQAAKVTDGYYKQLATIGQPLSAKNSHKRQLAVPILQQQANYATVDPYENNVAQQEQVTKSNKLLKLTTAAANGHMFHHKAGSLGPMSYSSSQSRFTLTRPKNPTDCSSVSSKGSDAGSVGSMGVPIGHKLSLRQLITQNHQQSDELITATSGINNNNTGPSIPDEHTNATQPSVKPSIKKVNSKAKQIPLKNKSAFPSSTAFLKPTPIMPIIKQGKIVTGNISPHLNTIDPKKESSVGQAPLVSIQPKKSKRKPSIKLNTNLSTSNIKAIGGPIKVEMSLSKHSSSAKQIGQKLIQQSHLVSSRFHGSSKDVGLSHDAIIEEQIEDSAQNTKRQSRCLKQSSHDSEEKKAQNLVSSVSHQHLFAALNKVVEVRDANTNQYSQEGYQTNAPYQIPQPQKLTHHHSAITLTSVPKSVGEKTKPPIAAPPPPPTAPINSHLQTLKQQLKDEIKRMPGGKKSSTTTGEQTPQATGVRDSNPQQPSSKLSQPASEVFPMSSKAALHYHAQQLSEFERAEIKQYQEIYFIGKQGVTKPGIIANSKDNYGFDDDRGDYKVVLKDHLAYRYEVVALLGSGSFGQALKCLDHKTQSYVAVKVIRNKKRFQHQAGVEVKILLHLMEQDPNDDNNIVRVKDFEIFRSHLLISFELLSINLYDFIKSNDFNGISLSLIRRFAIQILQALKFQRDLKIVHCDLKPENILLKHHNKSGIKIIDYGSSCFQNQRIYTYIQSRFYRAPEVILGIPYTTAIDMWSFGCIMAELYTGVPLFPGENEAEQLAYFMEVIGIPEDYILDLSQRRNLFFEKNSSNPIPVTNSRGRKRRPNTKTIQGILKCTDATFVDFITRCFDWDPANRMTPLQALQHNWILQDLPEKVKVHHFRMFGGSDTQYALKEATLEPVEGFPPDANKSINEVVEELKRKQEQARLARGRLLRSDLMTTSTSQRSSRLNRQTGTAHQSSSSKTALQKNSQIMKEAIREVTDESGGNQLTKQKTYEEVKATPFAESLDKSIDLPVEQSRQLTVTATDQADIPSIPVSQMAVGGSTQPDHLTTVPVMTTHQSILHAHPGSGAKSFEGDENVQEDYCSSGDLQAIDEFESLAQDDEGDIVLEELTPSHQKANTSINIAFQTEDQELVRQCYTQKLPISLIKQQEKGVKIPQLNPSAKIESINNFIDYKKQVPSRPKQASNRNGAGMAQGVSLNMYIKQVPGVKDLVKQNPIFTTMFAHRSGINNSLPKINSFAYSATGTAKHSIQMGQKNDPVLKPINLLHQSSGALDRFKAEATTIQRPKKQKDISAISLPKSDQTQFENTSKLRDRLRQLGEGQNIQGNAGIQKRLANKYSPEKKKQTCPSEVLADLSPVEKRPRVQQQSSQFLPTAVARKQQAGLLQDPGSLQIYEGTKQQVTQDNKQKQTNQKNYQNKSTGFPTLANMLTYYSR